MLVFLVFFTLTVTQASSVAQTAADAAVLRIQEHNALKSLPPDDPATPQDERKLAFIDLVRSDILLQEGRAEVYRRLCPSNRWIVGDSCADLGYNWPLDDYPENLDPADPMYDPAAPVYPEDCLDREAEPEQEETATARAPNRVEGSAGWLYRWPDVKVWIAFPNFILPARTDEDEDGDGRIDPEEQDLVCFFNPLQEIAPSDERWQEMMSHPIEAWRIVVLVDVRPVIPGLLNFFVGDPEEGPLRSVGRETLQRQAISCGPLFLSGNPDLWKC